jgi:hypothetical protein
MSQSMGLDGSVCLSSSCSFAWKTSLTPQFNSVQPSSISAVTDLTIFGINFLGGQNLSTNGTAAHIFIDEYACQIIGMTDTQINCSITALERGDHLITGQIDGLGHIQSSLYLTSNAIDRSHFTHISSVYGGGRFIIRGNGFPKNRSNLEVRIDGNPCVIITNDPGEIQCTIPSQSTSSSILVLVEVISSGLSIPSMFYLNYSQDVTPIITSVITQIITHSTQHVVETFFLETQVFESVEYRVRSCQCRPHQSVVGWPRISQLDIIQSLLMST